MGVGYFFAAIGTIKATAVSIAGAILGGGLLGFFKRSAMTIPFQSRGRFLGVGYHAGCGGIARRQ